MAWDIYGERLRPGYCEVHPWTHEEFPCHECQAAQQQAEYERDMYEEMRAAESAAFNEYCENQIREQTHCIHGDCI